MQDLSLVEVLPQMVALSETYLQVGARPPLPRRICHMSPMDEIATHRAMLPRCRCTSCKSDTGAGVRLVPPGGNGQTPDVTIEPKRSVPHPRGVRSVGTW